MPNKQPIITPDEVTAPDLWQPARDYYNAAQGFAKASVACQVMLGFELVSLKKKLGYVQGGKRCKSKTETISVFKTFEEHVTAEIGITGRTARNFINMSDAVKRRLNSCYKNLPLLDKPVTNYSTEELQLLDKAVEKCTDGETQKSLLEEWRIAKLPQGSAAKGGNLTSDKEESEEQEEGTMEQLALALFTDPINKLTQLRTNGDYEASLHSLPLIGDTADAISLTSLEVELKAALEDVQSAKKARTASLTTVND